MLSQNIDTPRFTSRVEEIFSDEIMIAMPMHKGRPIFLESGYKFYGKIINNSGVYFFKSKFLSKRMTPLPVWIIAMPYDLEKMQQREFVRFDVSQPLQIEYFLGDDESPVSLKVMTRDLSGGGLQAICSSPIKMGTKVKMSISLAEDDDLEVDGEVIRVQKPQEDRQLFWISIKFLDVRNVIRDKISRFIFKKQLEQRQKGI
ncbi:MAG: type pilus assembly PilZ [Pelosinus sp.]|nr:type pilus assembly PilZ [Pelosinus sp.]